ncbi:MAG: bifunctional phosphopantothenoylcysteine decarboxylase/phosphopantothenate--cysteine ligase CoaBC [Odoribacteraceae bacterium]|nr:bifunctional phosphopantothenoylcysteine decarboxylase/phosphopantothenate--cysteine ligase CoaBC [Odoribacteraceae bacterium]
MLEKNIILGVTGSIAAYKAAALARLLVKAGAAVKVVMTPLAKEFITPLTMATLSKNPIMVDFYDPENGAWNSHVDLGTWADLYLIAPASANTIGKMVAGIADNLLLTTYLSARCPVVIAPAMDMDMYAHPAVRHNLEVLRLRGDAVIEPGEGELASGLTGKGRMEEPEQILDFLERFFVLKEMAGVKVVVTAGPTREKIDPVRFVGNFSSGKMGYALARELADRGAEVVLVSGPTSLSMDHPGVRRVDVTSAGEMYDATVSLFPGMDVGVLCAAVADFTPVSPSMTKLKREESDLLLTLRPTRDIAAALGEMKGERQRLVGFALETRDEIANARAKMQRKNLDLIVLNSLNDAGAGFQVETNKVTILDREGRVTEYAVKPKRAVAADIADRIREIIT